MRDSFPSEVDPSFPPSPYPSSPPGRVAEAGHWEHTWPQYLVMFGSLETAEIISILHDKGYQRIWHAHYGFDTEENRSGGVVVWKYEEHDQVEPTLLT